MLSIPRRLAVLPLSRLDANSVALLISSARLVVLPLASMSRTASMSSFAGLLFTGTLLLIPGLIPSPSRGFVELAESGVFAVLFDMGASRSCGGSSSSLVSGVRGRDVVASKGILIGENVRAGGVESPGRGSCWAKPAAIAAVNAFMAVVRLEAGDISPNFGLTGPPRSVVAI